MTKYSLATASLLAAPTSSYLYPTDIFKRLTADPIARKYALTHRRPSSSPIISRTLNDVSSTPFMTDIDSLLTPESIFKKMDREMTEVMTNLQRRMSPGYEIDEDENKVELSIELPGIKAKDMTVELKSGGKILHIRGKRIIKDKRLQQQPRDGDNKKEDSSSATEIESHFEQNFSLGSRFDTENISANLMNGILTITVPKIAPVKDEGIHTIAVTEGRITSVSTSVETEETDKVLNEKENSDVISSKSKMEGTEGTFDTKSE